MKNLAKQLALAVVLLAAATSTNVCRMASTRAPRAMAFEQFLQSVKDNATNKPPVLAGGTIFTEKLWEEMKRKAFEEKRKMAMQQKKEK